MQRGDLRKFNLPDVPGVYLFKQGRKVLYIGKATSLRDRVRSYFDDDLIATRGPRIVDMITKADRIAHEPTPTVLEALVREAALIKKYLPAANVDGKDDSTFLYAVVTKEEIPRVLTLRGKDIDFKSRKPRFNLKSESSRLNLGFRAIYGPFPSGAQLRDGLRLIRRIFPFFDTAKPVSTTNKHHQARIEFNIQIKQYPRVFSAKEYRRTIRNVMLFLDGRGKQLRTTLEKEMKHAAREERFEDATEARRQLFSLNHIQDVSLIKDEIRYPQDVPVGTSWGYRIEAYDTAHLSGTNAIGVMTVVVDSTPVKKEYRTFRIRGVKPRRQKSGSRPKASGNNDDVASLREILSRRFAHAEWQFPNAIVVDGGKTHKKAAESVLKEAEIVIPVVAVVKDERHRPREVIGARAAGISESDAVLANAEAHRFSLSRHRYARAHQLRSK
ncbi:UvrB/UvrC motif-containing protein [Candidatus Kaiserbacteria bacterium]|nr:UvrB/UvrC motif-containing protein [Candidatus Kaiserbacteria bacterium]